MTAGSSNKQSRIGLRQMALSLPEGRPSYDRESFIRSESNEAAWRACHAWLESGEPALIICGPEGSGKTHLAHVLAEDCKAVFLAAEYFGDNETPGAELVVIDDMPANDPRGFLAALENSAAAGKRMILAGRGHPSEWAQGLKDLRTRLEAMPRAVLEEPGETLIGAVIAKGFRDRQISVSPEVVKFAALRLSRTFAAAHAFVALADKLSLEEKRKITMPFVQKFLDSLSEDDPAA
jgi:chromosomal replication initiation ATPase DnaA